MKRRSFPWQRVLIGLLLILNAFPFSLDNTNQHFIIGLLFAVAGLIVTFFPSVPDDGFSFWDLLSVTVAAVFAAIVIMFFNKIPPLAVVLFTAGAIVFFCIPRHLQIRKWFVAISAHDLLCDLESTKIITEAEHEQLNTELLNRVK